MSTDTTNPIRNDDGSLRDDTMTDTTERAAFEALINKDCGDLSTFGSGQNTHYRNSAVNNAWIGWKARAARALAAEAKLAAQAAPVQHLYRGDCPEASCPESRDPECPACRAMDAQAAAVPAMQPREHETSADCWCNPEIDYTDPETGVSVYIHKRPQ